MCERTGSAQAIHDGQNCVITVLVEFNDLSFELAANVRLRVADATHLNEGCRQEATQTDVENSTALDDLDDSTGNDAVLFLDLLDRTLGTLVLCTLLRKKQTAFLVLHLRTRASI